MKYVSALILAMGFTVSGGAVHASDAATMRVALRIEPQPVRLALKQFSDQSGVQVLLRVDNISVDGVVAPKVNGELTVQAALERLLANSGLKYEFVNDRTVRISSAAEAPRTNVAEEGSERPLDAARAQNESPRVGETSVHRSDEDSASAEPGSSGSQLEEIVVSAQKREERLLDVPISISVLNGRDLDKSQATGATELLSRVPGLFTGQTGQGGGTLVTLRGVGPTAALFNGSTAVAYYLDSVPFGLVKSAIAPDLSAYDLDRIEVLRGPQGTLYGANALNGVVRVLTHDADLDAFALKARASGSGTKGGGENYRGDVAVNVPIIQDKLAVRAVAGYEDFSGWIEHPGFNNANDYTRSNLRLKINAQPTEEFSLGASMWRSREDRDDISEGITPDTNFIAALQPYQTDFNSYGLTLGYQARSFAVSSKSSYIDYDNSGLVFLAGVTALDLTTALSSQVFSEEINVTSSGEGSWRWSFGGMYRDGKDGLFQTLPCCLPAPIDWTDKSESYAVFGELTRRLLDDRLELTGGLRYFEDRVQQVQNISLTGNPADVGSDRNTFHAVTPRALLTFHANQNVMLYTSYSEGFRSGFAQNPLTILANPGVPPVEPDELENYEVGSKGSLLDHRIEYELAGYYIKWKEVQQPGQFRYLGNPISGTVNGVSASGLGFDAAVTVRPVEGLSLTTSLSWNDLTNDEQVTTAGLVVINKGSRIANSPETTIGGAADYAFALGGNGLTARLSVSANYVSKVYAQQSGVGSATQNSSDDLLVARMSFAVDAAKGWTAALFAENLFDEDGAPQVILPGENTLRIRPRTIGLQLEYRL
jgi:outer membrane receptor protein involved in Fe transport